jgi:hypothetical protein
LGTYISIINIHTSNKTSKHSDKKIYKIPI